VGANAHGLGADEVRDFGRVGATDLDALDLHAAVHVEGLALEQRSDLGANQEALASKVDGRERGAKDRELCMCPAGVHGGKDEGRADAGCGGGRLASTRRGGVGVEGGARRKGRERAQRRASGAGGRGERCAREGGRSKRDGRNSGGGQKKQQEQERDQERPPVALGDPRVPRKCRAARENCAERERHMRRVSRRATCRREPRLPHCDSEVRREVCGALIVRR